MTKIPSGAPPEKNLLLIPARVALALQADGWIIRNDCIWSKLNPMPESVTDRCTRAHEYVFMLVKQGRYFYDADAIREPHKTTPEDYDQQRKAHQQGKSKTNHVQHGNGTVGYNKLFSNPQNPAGRNKRTVWTLSSQPYPGSHFAVFPEALVEICLKAGSAARACEHCGAAWGRVVERTDELDTSAKGSKFDTGKTGVNGQGRVQAGERYAKRAGDFAPRCQCADNAGAASSVVLDPFAGSGTVMKVAERFGRDAIGIDLNPDYTDLQKQRTNGVQKELFV